MKQTIVILSTILFCASLMAQGVTPPPPPKPECHEIVYSKWNDMLIVDNGDNLYVAYQWYRDNVAIVGATRQYLYTEGVTMRGDGHTYYAIVTKTDGTQLTSCEGAFEDFPRSANLNQGTIRKAVLYSYTGRKIGEWRSLPAQLNIARGMYVWQLTDSNGNTWTEKVVY